MTALTTVMSVDVVPHQFLRTMSLTMEIPYRL
jgi:hypothetical protein